MAKSGKTRAAAKASKRSTLPEIEAIEKALAKSKPRKEK